MRPDQERLAASLESFQGTPANVDWEVGSACVAKSDKWYFRGVITHLIGPKILEVGICTIEFPTAHCALTFHILWTIWFSTAHCALTFHILWTIWFSTAHCALTFHILWTIWFSTAQCALTFDISLIICFPTVTCALTFYILLTICLMCFC